VTEEACALNLAPTASTTVMLALGDALAMEVSRRRGFKAEDFAELHPGGKLGKRLAKVEQLMHTGARIPVVAPTAALKDVILEMSSKGFGVTTVVEAGMLVGVVSDGDLRRLLEREGGEALKRTAAEVMNRTPRTIAPEEMAARALAMMEERKITSLVVVDGQRAVKGVIHLHDLWGMELI
jgi:arabinose-5-phosphate isomerase